MPRIIDYGSRFAFLREAAFEVVLHQGVAALSRQSVAARRLLVLVEGLTTSVCTGGLSPEEAVTVIEDEIALLRSRRP